jgi:hypothetical protein
MQPNQMKVVTLQMYLSKTLLLATDDQNRTGFHRKKMFMQEIANLTPFPQID